MSQTGMAFDLSGFLANAERADIKLQDMVAHSRQLKENLDSALNGQSATSFLSVLDRIKNTMTGLNGMRVSAFDTKNIEEAYTAMDRVVTVVKTMSQQKGAVLFDTQSLYATDQGVLQLGEKLKNIDKEMSRVRKEWSELSTFQAPVNARTGKEFKPESKAYQNAEASYRAEREAQMRLLIEKKAIASQELNWAKMTQDEKLAYIEKALQRELQAEQRRVNEARKEYRTLVKEQLDITKKNDKLQKSGIGAAGAPMQREYEQQFLALDSRRKELEAQYGQFVVDIARNAQRQVLDLEVKRIQDRQAAEKAAQEQQWQKYLSSPEGALTLAKNAKTINEMREAQKYLTTARDNTNVKDAKTIDTLNQAYQRLRVQIEQLTTAEKNEQTLQPTIRNEYARMLKELDKLAAAKKKASETDAYKSGDAKAQQNYADIAAREQDVRNKILEIEKNSQGMLDEVKRQHRANNAMLEVAETQKIEQQKAEIARKRFEEQRAEAQKLETWSSQKVGGVIGQTTNAANVAQQEAAIKKLTEARRHLDQNDAKYEATLKKLNAEIKRHEHALKMATDANYRKKQAEKEATKPENALAYARGLESGVRSINSMTLALERCRKAQKGLDLNTKEGMRTYMQLDAEIKKIEKSLGGVQNKSKGVLDTAGQLKRALAGVFSVSAIKGYITKLIEVRGELELQQTALRAIIGNKQEADLVWTKVTSLAVKSPFSVQQLVTYTKQLAAYRVETKKLYDTTKMLADVSAGLGVDMGRLILAFGQVKAANYLRGTELRQFTEAGVNMLQELVWYFEEVEGKSYTVAQIFEMISKRKVTFEAVEKVFERMTSEGGLFFDMQSKQAETLKGKMSNLKDSITLMFNEMGEKNSGVLHGFLSDLKDIINNWEYWASIATPLVNALIMRFALLKTAMAVGYIKHYFVQFMIGFSVARSSAIGFGVAMRGLLSVNVVGWIILIIGAIAALVAAFSKTETIWDKYSGFVAAAKAETEDLVSNYKKLVDVINDSTRSTRDRDAAYKELVRTYGDYFTQQELELENIKKLNGVYDEQIAKLQLIRQDKEREQVIESMKSERPDYEIENMQRLYSTSYSGVASVAVWKAQFDRMVRDVIAGISPHEAWATFMEEVGVRDFTDAPGQFYSWDRWVSTITNPFSSNLVRNQNKVVEYINALSDASKDEFSILKRIIREREHTATTYGKTQLGFYSQEDVNKELYSMLYGATEMPYIDEAGIAGVKTFTEKEKQYINVYLQSLDTTITDWEKSYQGIMHRLFEFDKISDDFKQDIQNLFEKSTNFDAYKAVEELLKDYNESVKKFENAMAAGDTSIASISQDEYNSIQAMLPNLNLLFNYLGGELEKENKSQLQQLKDKIAFIRKLADDYQEMWDKYGKTYADLNIWSKARIAEAKELKLNPQKLLVGGRAEEKENLNSLLKQDAGIKGGTKEVNKAVADVEVEIDWEVKENANLDLTRTLDEMFDDYELSLELTKMNVPRDAMKSLFGVESIELPQLRATVLQELGVDSELAKESDKDILDSDFYKSLDKHIRDEIRKRLEEISEMELKLQRENLKKYIEFARGAISERAKIKLEELNKIAEINKAFEIKDDDTNEQREAKEKYKAAALEQASKEAMDALQKLDWEAFRSGESFNMIFDDLEHAGDEALNSVIKRLKEFKKEWKDMPFAQMKQVNDLLQKAEEAMSSTDNPFKEAKRLRRATRTDGRSMQDAQVVLFDAEAEMLKTDSLMAKLEVFGQVRDGLRKESALSKDDLALYQQFKENQSDFVTSITKGLLNEEELRSSINIGLESGADLMEIVTEQLQKQKSAQQDIATSAKTQVTNLKKLPGEYKKQADVLSQINDKAKELYDAFMDLGTNAFALFGKELDENAKVFADMGASMMETIMNTIELQLQLKSATAGAAAFGTALNSAMGISGWIVMAGQLLSQAFGAIVQAHDNNLQEQIDAEAKSVERLQKAYEDLEEQIKNTYDISELNSTTKAAQDNLLARINATERMIDAEEDKKESDQDAIDGYKDEIENLKKQYKELEETRLQELGAFASDENKKSGAEAFLDAWMEAYKQTGDGLSGLNEKFDEFFEDSVKRQMLQKATSKYLDNLFYKYDSAISDWAEGGLTDEELNEKLSGLKNDLPALNENLKKWAEATGVAAEFAGKDADLSGLQAGIQGITEDQADILAAYWSNVSMYTYDINQKVNEIATKLFSSETDKNPMLSYLETIAQQTTTICNLFDDMLTQNTDKFVKVKMIG